MANAIDDTVLDGALTVIATGTVLHICSTQPANYAGVAAATCGNKATPTIGAAGDRTGGGRKRTVSAITDGTVTATATAAYWALVTASVLLATGTLSATQVVTSGNTFSLNAFDIGIPDPA
jgi:hypothetical protein